MGILKKILKILLIIVMVPVLYVLVSLILTSITVNDDFVTADTNQTIYISTNGVHLDIILPIDTIDPKLMKDLNVLDANYLAFGWGDEDFYLNTPTWADLKASHAFSAMFLKSKTLMHLTRYRNEQTNWVAVKLTSVQLSSMNSYILDSFQLDADGSKMVLDEEGYSIDDDFYKAIGSYSFLKTCNTWVNSAFKNSQLKSCYWTPVDFGLINKYKN